MNDNSQNKNNVSEETFKPTLGNKPELKQSVNYEKNFNKTMKQYDIKLEEGILNEKEQSLKKKIFNLAKMEALVFSDPKLSAVYDEMSANGEERYGYHYNETIMNLIFNDYVLNSPKYLQKYKQAIPQEKKRRDKSGINQLKQAGEENMTNSNIDEMTGAASSGAYVAPLQNDKIDETTTASSAGGAAGYVGYAGPSAWSKNGKPAMNKPMIYGGTVIQESEYLIDPIGFEKFYIQLNEESDINFIRNNSEEYGSLNNMNKDNLNIIKQDIENKQYDIPNIDNNVDEKAVSKAQQRFMGMVHAVKKGELSPNNVGGDVTKAAKSMSDKDAEDFAATKHDELPERIDELSLHDTVEYVSDMNGENPFDLQGVKWQFVKAKYPDGKVDIGVYRFDHDLVYDYNKWKKEMNINENMIGNNSTSNYYQKLDPKSAIQKAKVDTEYARKMNNDGQIQKIAGNLMSHLTNKGYNWKEDPYAMEILGDTMINEALNGRFNQKDYIFYVVDPITRKIESGWEFKEDAIDHKNEIGDKVKVYSKKYLLQNDVDPDDNNNWGAVVAEQTGDENTSVVVYIDGKFYTDFDSKDEALWYLGGKFKGEDYKFFLEKGLLSFDGNKIIINTKADVSEDAQSMIGDSPDTMAFKSTPVGVQSSNMEMGMNVNENNEKLFEELNNELNAFSIHHDKLKKMTEDRKPSSLVLKDRLGDENKANFKKDMQHSGTKEIIDVEKELQYKDQQTEVGDPQKAGLDIEKKSYDKSLENVGDSANDNGKEIPKRNLTDDEQNEVNMYRLGLSDVVFDNKPSEKFENRMKTDMGERIYKERQDKMEFRAKAPMYNKDTQPTEKGVSKSQFNKYESGWNEREGLNESMTGRYFDVLGKKRLIDFKINEAVELTSSTGDARESGLFEINFDGLGNTYTSKVSVNESVVNVMNSYKFYTDGTKDYLIKNSNTLNESVNNTGKPVVNEQYNKMKHLLGYKPSNYTNTNNIKKNRGF